MIRVEASLYSAVSATCHDIATTLFAVLICMSVSRCGLAVL